MPSESPPIRNAESLEAELDKFPHLREHPKFEKLRADCDIYFHALEFKNVFQHDEVTLVQIAKEVGTSDTQVSRWLVKEKEPRLLWQLNHEHIQATTLKHFHHTDTHKTIPEDPILRAANDPEYRKSILPPPEFTPKNIERLLQLRSEHDKNLDPTQLTKITSYPMYLRARRGVGYLPQETSIFRKLTVKQNILAILETLPISKTEQNDRANTLLDELGIKNLSHQKAIFLSGGEKRRLEISRALATNPSFILLDEPFAGIDPLALIDIKKIIEDYDLKGSVLVEKICEKKENRIKTSFKSKRSFKNLSIVDSTI